MSNNINPFKGFGEAARTAAVHFENLGKAFAEFNKRHAIVRKVRKEKKDGK